MMSEEPGGSYSREGGPRGNEADRAVPLSWGSREGKDSQRNS